MGKVIGEGTRPLICTPLVGRTREEIMAELAAVLPKKPDIVEWRADYFAAIADTAAVIGTAKAIRQAVGDLPILFTIRSKREGGQPVPLPDQRAAIELNAAVCRETDVEYIDIELSNKPVDITYVRDIAHANGTKIVASYHNFDHTPSRAILRSKFAAVERYGLDICKVAVMPQSLEDVLTLLSATLEAKRKGKLPLITMSMSGYGVVTRMVGGIFGSSLTFAVGQNASAPGQVPIEDLRLVMDIVEKSTGR
jgi:3-dehydroquinate dehydratase-1